MDTLFIGLVILSWFHLIRVRGVVNGVLVSALWACALTGLRVLELWLTGPGGWPAFADHALVVLPLTTCLVALGYIAGAALRLFALAFRPAKRRGLEF